MAHLEIELVVASRKDPSMAELPFGFSVRIQLIATT